LPGMQAKEFFYRVIADERCAHRMTGHLAMATRSTAVWATQWLKDSRATVGEFGSDTVASAFAPHIVAEDGGRGAADQRVFGVGALCPVRRCRADRDP
jgi:hypothetical protein